MRQFKYLLPMLASVLSFSAWAGQTLVSAEKLKGGWIWSAKAIAVARQELNQSALEMPKGSSVDAYKIKYRTKDLNGKETIASGLLRVRSDLVGAGKTLPVISYQHSTRILRNEAPSVNILDPEAVGGTVYFASQGYMWLMPDYLGLGTNRDPQSYLHAHGQAVICVDFLRAVEDWASENDVTMKSEIIAMGYSQGGHSTLALQKYLESAENRSHFSVRASFPMAGPYSVAGVGLEQALKAKSSSQFLFVALALYGLSADKSLNILLSDIIGEKYQDVLPKLFDGKTSFEKSAESMPKKAEDFFTPQFLASVLLQQTAQPALAALQKQDVVDFHAKAPVYLIHAPGDRVVPYQNSVLAEKYLKQRGTQVRLITLDASLDHVSAALPAFEAAAQIIKTELNAK